MHIVLRYTICMHIHTNILWLSVLGAPMTTASPTFPHLWLLMSRAKLTQMLHLRHVTGQICNEGVTPHLLGSSRPGDTSAHGMPDSFSFGSCQWYSHFSRHTGSCADLQKRQNTASVLWWTAHAAWCRTSVIFISDVQPRDETGQSRVRQRGLIYAIPNNICIHLFTW